MVYESREETVLLGESGTRQLFALPKCGNAGRSATRNDVDGQPLIELELKHAVDGEVNDLVRFIEVDDWYQVHGVRVINALLNGERCCRVVRLHEVSQLAKRRLEACVFMRLFGTHDSSPLSTTAATNVCVRAKLRSASVRDTASSLS